MSYESLLQNREHMGYGALTGLFRESPAQPSYTFTRNNQRLRQLKESNAEKNTTQDEILKYIYTAWNSLQHVCIYKITPKLYILQAKCKAIAKHMDAASLCIIMCAMFALFIILLSRFIVDYEDIHSNTPNIIDPVMDHTTIIPEEAVAITNDTNTPPIDNIAHLYHEIEVVQEYDTIDNLFKPTPIPIIEEETIAQEEEDSRIIRDFSFNQWVLINSVNWNDIKTGQIIKVKAIKNNKVSTAMIHNIDVFKMNIEIEYENCWVLCHETMDIIASRRMIYLIKPPIHTDTRDSEENKEENTVGNNDDPMDGIIDIDDHVEPPTVNQFDPSSLYESMDQIHEEQNEFKQWVHSQFTDIQQNNDEFKDVLTDYLDDKMTQMLQMLQTQQNVIQSIQNHQQQAQQTIDNNNQSGANQIDWDWDSIEDRMDNRIESVVRVQLEEKFGTLAQEIGQEIAKEIAAQQPVIPTHHGNGDIIKGNDNDEDHTQHHEEDMHRKKETRIDWAYHVVSHSKLKTNNDDNIFHKYGYWLMYDVLSKWNQQSILTTHKPGDCTPLAFDRRKEQSDAYITIELYKPIHVKQVSLYHYHSAVLTQTAINAAPKEFQIWGSYNLSKWYDLGNFSYDYYEEKYTQYFDVVDIIANKSETEERKEMEDVVLEDDMDLHTEIVNDTVVSTNEEVYEDYSKGFKYIAFRLLSNYGGSDYACVYRLRVFGDAVVSVAS
eukprot:179653_1